jgi:4,5-DOPA dioxygenase extradiol
LRKTNNPKSKGSLQVLGYRLPFKMLTMNRKQLLGTLATIPLIGISMKLQDLKKWSDGFQKSEKMPALFIGHGHPMNALMDNSFTQKLQAIGASMEKPAAIMVVSAHWETRGTFVSVNANPHTIYDFGRFDNRLFNIKYEPQGHPVLANEVTQLGQDYHIKTDHSMGLDHGAWTVLKYLYPKADVPVFQLSIDYTKPATYHFELANALRALRRKGVLVIGSGNIVHNLRILDWHNANAKPFDWAVEFDEKVKEKLANRNFLDLVNYQNFGTLGKMAIPSNDHYLPMVYTLGLAEEGEHVEQLYEGIQYGSISMRCFKIS